ncbi:MAG: ABC transporter ATP-binding protein [Myxococcales bacterium]
MIELRGIGKSFERRGVERVQALSGVSLTLKRGELLAIIGTSGSGKSTLMNIMGLLDRPTEGQYLIDGQDVTRLSVDEEARWRNQRFGFVFQAFRLLPRATAEENVELPLLYSDRQEINGLARAALEAVGLAERVRHRPTEMSGGQQQRVAVARALVNAPDVILADEPTGNLDARSALEVMALFQKLHREGRTIVIVTHDPQIAAHCSRVARIERGRIVADEPVPAPKDAAEELARLPVPAPASATRTVQENA